ncbi:MAG: hypothetical protein JWO06_3173 [Bacteroidota bacterium]|nr:hypothetical protein [Bacteroidota bacterium]
MDYNSSRSHLVLKEYGRHVQLIVEACVRMKDRDKRNEFAKELIELMGQLNPHLRNVEDFRHKLWDHLFIMSDYKLDVDSPYPIKGREEIEKRPKRLPYPQSRIKYKHYGKNVEALVAKAITTEDIDKKAGFTQCIGNFMKLVYQNWSKENVNDETIKNDLRLLSKGALVVSDDQDINSLARANRMKKPREDSNNNNRKGSGGGKFRHGSGGGGGGSNNNNRNKHFKKKRPPM